MAAYDRQITSIVVPWNAFGLLPNKPLAAQVRTGINWSRANTSWNRL
jgi:hypothetical protein